MICPRKLRSEQSRRCNQESAKTNANRNSKLLQTVLSYSRYNRALNYVVDFTLQTCAISTFKSSSFAFGCIFLNVLSKIRSSRPSLSYLEIFPELHLTFFRSHLVLCSKCLFSVFSSSTILFKESTKFTRWILRIKLLFTLHCQAQRNAVFWVGREGKGGAYGGVKNFHFNTPGVYFVSLHSVQLVTRAIAHRLPNVFCM